MRNVQRLPSIFRNEKIDWLIECSKKYKGSFNEVWLTTESGYPPFDVHKRTAKSFAESAAKLRKAGIAVSVELLGTIGHGQYKMIRDNRGLVYENSPAEIIVGHDGSVCRYAFCWRGENFRKYILETVKIYVSAVKPDVLWIDDDFRAWNHDPVKFGCFCEKCIKGFNQKYSYSFTRDTLVEEFLHGDIQVRADFIDFMREGLADFMTEICKAVKSVSPNTSVSLENGPNGPYTGRGYDFIFDAIYRTTGKAPMYRPGAGAYNDHDPGEIVKKVYDLAYQASLLPEYVTGVCPEIENIPHTAMSKTMHGTAFEATMNFANGATDISFAMLGELPEPYGFYEEGFALFSALEGYWRKLSETSKRTLPGGITFALPAKAHLRKLQKNENLLDFNTEYYEEGIPMAALGVPLCYKDTGVYLLHPKALSQMSNGEITDLLSKKLITDWESAEYIQSRGIDLGFAFKDADVIDHLVMKEEYTDVLGCAGHSDTNFASVFAKGYGKNCFITKIPENSLVLGKYREHSLLNKCSDAPDAPFGYSSVITDTVYGGKLAVMACGFWKLTCHSTQRDRILDVIDFLSPMPARLLSPRRALVMPRVDREGNTVSVSVTNCTLAYPEDIVLKIRSPKKKHFRFASQYDGEQILHAEETPDGYIVKLPRLSAYSVCTVFCDEQEELSCNSF